MELRWKDADLSLVDLLEANGKLNQQPVRMGGRTYAAGELAIYSCGYAVGRGGKAEVFVRLVLTERLSLLNGRCLPFRVKEMRQSSAVDDLLRCCLAPPT